jgi:hypothetical protein
MKNRNEIPWQVRQGDVLIERKDTPVETSGLKEIPREDGGVVLAHGEVTGHKHQFRDPGIAFLRNESSGERIVVVDVAGLLEHEEHVPPIEVGAGQYAAIQQCEWDWTKQAGRSAAD